MIDYAKKIPPIRGNPRLGRETENDASVVLGGAKLPEPAKKLTKPTRKPTKRVKQKKFAIHHPDLAEVAQKVGVNETAVINMGIALVKKNFCV
jgi:hypothetical protein